MSWDLDIANQWSDIGGTVVSAAAFLYSWVSNRRSKAATLSAGGARAEAGEAIKRLLIWRSS